MTLYLDATALVKLVAREPETTVLRRYLSRRPDSHRVTSSLSRVEVVRAVSAGGTRAAARAREVLDRLHEVPLDRALLDRAAVLRTSSAVRSVEVVHLASALVLGSTLEALITYDVRMAAAAASLGIEVAAPS